jgi:hypothetical protein
MTSLCRHRGEADVAPTYSKPPALKVETGQQHGSVGLNSGRPIVRWVWCATGPVWVRKENVAPTDIRSPDFPVRGESLYRLRYTGLKTTVIKRNEDRVLIHYSPPIRSWYRNSVSETVPSLCLDAD